VSIENMSRDELIEAVVEFQVQAFTSGRNLSELRSILLYGNGYKTYSLADDRHWPTDQLRDYARRLGV
jgi:hypothetical protein